MYAFSVSHTAGMCSAVLLLLFFYFFFFTTKWHMRMRIRRALVVLQVMAVAMQTQDFPPIPSGLAEGMECLVTSSAFIAEEQSFDAHSLSESDEASCATDPGSFV